MKTEDISTLNFFLTEYILSLSERTRFEKDGAKWGFDQLIYSLAIAKDWQLIRIPFFRQGAHGTTTTKTEAEFGVDLAFLDPSKTELYVFVLKDETLTNRNWTTNNFDTDIRMAATPSLEMAGLESVRAVKVILAYNKDEDHNGVELYDRLVSSLGTLINNKVSLSFERWNLSKIVEEAKLNLLSPELLPLHLSRQFRDICVEVQNCDYGSKEWEDRVVFNWCKFLNSLLEPPIDIKRLNLIPVTLLILHNYRKETPNSSPGWIDLTEWAILAVWRCCLNTSDKPDHDRLRQITQKITVELYVAELARYLNEVSLVFTTEHGFGNTARGQLSIVNDPYLTYWHTSRLGMLALGYRDFALRDTAEIVRHYSELVMACLSANPAIFRPLIDLNHIDLFLIWFLLLQSGQPKHISEWLSELESRLTIRRARKFGGVPFIESRNRIELVAEYIATSNRPPEYTDSSSYLVLMLMEICFCLDEKDRDELVERFYRRVVCGIGDDGKKIADYPLDLMSWVPPQDWCSRILKESVYDGIAINTHHFSNVGDNQSNLADKIQDFVTQVRTRYPWQLPANIPQSIVVLACLKYGSPLPPEFWRSIVFPYATERKS
ncbi:MAG: hypothetical protein KAV98_00810 [Dehalococcoidia bacterium]|nr:hypothetical protein [Dehalococcoidia bacterium]